VIPGVVLVGSPGSGKTAVGQALAAGFGYRYLDREAQLLAEFGSREGFLAAKATAVPAMQLAARQWMSEDHSPWVYESAALTERDFVEALGSEGALLVRLAVSRALAVERVTARAAGGNFENSPAETARMWDLCASAHAGLQFGLEVDSDELAPHEVAKAVDAAFRTPRRRAE
jgi:chloramphenicol 3-O-phosphotransferase